MVSKFGMSCRLILREDRIKFENLENTRLKIVTIAEIGQKIIDDSS